MPGEDQPVEVPEVEEGMSSNYMGSLPINVKKRVKALKKLQVDTINCTGDFYKDVGELEKKYQAKFNEINKKRAEIVNGKYEPNDADCQYKETNDELAAELEKVTIEDKSVTGIPSFWLTCLKNAVEISSDFFISADEPILEHLTDVVLDEFGDTFKLTFHFSSNEYFSNSTLTKEYKVQLTPKEDDPFAFDGPEIYAKKGCKIDWKSEDKNVTQKKVTKKQKNKKSGNTRTVTKTIPTDSFFNFFNNPEWEEMTEDMDDDAQEMFASDMTLATLFKDRLVPRAVLFFTGEATNFEEEFDEEVDEEEDIDEDADPDFKPSKKELKKHNQQQPPECKQQ